MFETKAEQDYVLKVLRQNTDSDGVLIGGTKKDNKWYTNSSGTLKHINYEMEWMSGEPNDEHGVENCLDVIKKSWSYVLNDIKCNLRNTKFLCEIQG